MIVRPNGLEYTVVELGIGSLYLSSLLSNLNARQFIRGRQMEWNEYLSSTILHGDEDRHNGGGTVVLKSMERVTDYGGNDSHIVVEVSLSSVLLARADPIAFRARNTTLARRTCRIHIVLHDVACSPVMCYRIISWAIPVNHYCTILPFIWHINIARF